MNLKQRALDAAKESEARTKKQQRARRRNAEKRARAAATDAIRKVLAIPEDDEPGELILRDQDGVGFVTTHEGFDFHVLPSTSSSDVWNVYVVLGDEEHKIANLAQLGKVLKAHGGAK